jgi:hypothetical protein
MRLLGSAQECSCGSALQELKADMDAILQVVHDWYTNNEDTCELGISGELLHTDVYVHHPVVCVPLQSSPYLHISVRAAVLSTPSGWELSVAVRTKRTFDFGQERYKFWFGPALAQGVAVPRIGAVQLHVIISVAKQVPPMMIIAEVAL